MDNEILEAALRYQEMGFSVIPIRPKDKKPLIKWEEFQTRKAGPDEIKVWWQDTPGANVAIVTGKISGFDVVDIDSAAGEDLLIEALGDELSGFRAPAVKTPRGGKHIYVKSTGEGNKTGFLQDVDFRGQGGYIVAPPSRGPNGNQYAWMPGLSIFEIAPPALPDAIYKKINLYLCGDDTAGKNGVVNNRQTSSNVVISFDQGYRDNTLFHLANCLIKGGMPIEETQQFLALIATKLCNPPYPQKDISTKIQSALKRAQSRDRNLTQEVREWVMSSNGVFLSSDVVNCLQVSSSNERKHLSKILSRCADEGLIERIGSRNGQFRRVDTECEVINWINADDRPFNIIWPLGIERLALLYRKTIAVIAGSQNAGKTCLALNIAWLNRKQSQVRYLSSEMGASELKGRLSKFGHPLEDWKMVDFRERSSNFVDVLQPDGLNIIDYYEISDKFWIVADELKRIYEKLKKGIAIVCLQKTQGKDAGRGGDFGLEKPRLYLNLDQDPPDGGILSIRKAKEWAQEGKNPNYRKIRFNIVSGSKIIQRGDWF